MHDSQEKEHPAEPAAAVHAAVAEPQGDAEASRPSARDHRTPRGRPGTQSSHWGLESGAARLGQLLPDGERRPGVQPDGPLCVSTVNPLAPPAGGPKNGAMHSVDQGGALGNWTVHIAG